MAIKAADGGPGRPGSPTEGWSPPPVPWVQCTGAISRAEGRGLLTTGSTGSDKVNRQDKTRQ